MNTVYGRDNGPTPPAFGRGAPFHGFGQPGFGQNGSLPPFQGMPFMLPSQFRHPPPVAVDDKGFPGTLLRNFTGGTGLEPGYNYLYPMKHAKIHVFKTTTKPWAQHSFLLPTDDRIHLKLYVPVNMTVKELMQNLGCKNDDAAKNILYECVEKGNGRWASGIRINGKDDRVKKTVGELNWDETRTGAYGGRPVTWIWCTSEGK